LSSLKEREAAFWRLDVLCWSPSPWRSFMGLVGIPLNALRTSLSCLRYWKDLVMPRGGWIGSLRISETKAAD
jgi:hypothetical protein